MSEITTDTYCPIFPGFYETEFDVSDDAVDSQLSSEEEFRERYPELSSLTWDYIVEKFWESVDYAGARLEIAKACVASLPKLYPGIVISAEFQELRSPREYNFANDAINCRLVLDTDKIREILAENLAEWDAWLGERYTDRSGFISFYPNTAEKWEGDTNGYEDLSGHYGGAVLDFLGTLEYGGLEQDMIEAARVREIWHDHTGANIDVLLEEAAKDP